MTHWVRVAVAALGIFAPFSLGAAPPDGGGDVRNVEAQGIALPPPATRSATSLEEALAARRSVREFAPVPLTRSQLSQLLWAAQGITGPGGQRTAPSAGALYPLELYVATADGLHQYVPDGHRLIRRISHDVRSALRRAALDQEAVGTAPAVFVIAAVQARTEVKYGSARSPRYLCMEAGHAAQNLLLEAAALGLGGVPVGAFDDERVWNALGLPADQRPLYLIPVGKARR